jgi:phosphatidylserine/phosphatidylglycerophosphate/cardiolipin synthase-like enzyme
VRVVYDAGKRAPGFRAAGADPAPPGTADFLRRLGPGVACKAITGGDPHLPRLMHHKYLVRDGRTSNGTVWTGSTNFTDDSWTFQENNIVRVESAELCTYYETDFEELWAKGDIATTGANDTGTVRVGTVAVGVALAPGQGRAIDHEIAGTVSRARRRLKVCSMLLNSGTILGALCDALKHGRVPDYGGVYDRKQMEAVLDQWRGTPSEWKIAAFRQAAQGLAGKRSTPYAPNTRHNFLHDKLLVADDAVVTGSYNFSHSATENAENVLFLHDPALADRYAATIDALAVRYGGAN